MSAPPCSGTSLLRLDMYGADMGDRHIEGVWAVDMDALRLASASHGRFTHLPQVFWS